MKNITRVICLGISLILNNLSSVAFADEQDTLNFVVGITTRYDDNLFRQVNNTQSDTNISPFVGLNLNKQYSLQRFSANVNIANNRYRTNDYLNYTSTNFNAAWSWSLTPKLTGKISATRSQSLNNFNDTQNTVQSIRTSQTQAFLADYNPGGGWHALAGFSRQTLKNSVTFNQDASFSANAVDFGVRYVFPSNSEITILNHVRKGNFDERKIDAFAINNLLDAGYKEYETEVQLDWNLTAKSSLALVTSYLKRQNDNFSVRDYSGMQGSVRYSWLPTAKISVGFSLNSNLNAFQTNVDSYTRTNTLALTPTYAITPKINLNSSLSLSKREFLGNGPTTQTGSARSDDQTSASIGLQWTPTRNSTVGINLQHINLDSNQDFFDYKSNAASLTGNILF